MTRRVVPRDIDEIPRFDAAFGARFYRRAAGLTGACASRTARVQCLRRMGVVKGCGSGRIHACGGRRHDDDLRPRSARVLGGRRCDHVKFGQIAGSFPEIRRPVRRARHDRGQEPQRSYLMRRCARILGFVRTENEEDISPGGSNTPTARLSQMARPPCDIESARHEEGGDFPRHAQPYCTDEQARHPEIRRMRGGKLWAPGAHRRRITLKDPVIRRDPRLLTIAELIEYDAEGEGARAKCTVTTDAKGRHAADQSVGRAQSQNPDRCNRGVDHALTAMQLTAPQPCNYPNVKLGDLDIGESRTMSRPRAHRINMAQERRHRIGRARTYSRQADPSCASAR